MAVSEITVAAGVIKNVLSEEEQFLAIQGKDFIGSIHEEFRLGVQQALERCLATGRGQAAYGSILVGDVVWSGMGYFVRLGSEVRIRVVRREEARQCKASVVVVDRKNNSILSVPVTSAPLEYCQEFCDVINNKHQGYRAVIRPGLTLDRRRQLK